VKKYISTILFLTIIASSSHIFGNENDSIETLRKELLSSSLEQRCKAAVKLGEVKDMASVAVLAEMSESDIPDSRKCAVEALTLYQDQGYCQDFFDMWLTDGYEIVRKAAGIAVVVNDCENHIERSSKYAMDAKTCGYTQFFTNTVRDAVYQAKAGEDWKNSVLKIKFRETIVDEGTPDEIINMRLNLVFSSIDWGESVMQLRNLNDNGTVDKNRNIHASFIEEYKAKEEFVKQFCPKLLFPDFSYWNDIVGKKY